MERNWRWTQEILYFITSVFLEKGEGLYQISLVKATRNHSKAVVYWIGHVPARRQAQITGISDIHDV